MHSFAADDRRTTALAYWRYAHEYLRAARLLAGRHRLPCTECQPVYHLVVQALEFALKAHLRARGMPACEVAENHTARLERTLAACSERGLEAPARVTKAVQRLAAHHTRVGFVAVHRVDPLSDLVPLFEATEWLLDAAVVLVADDYVLHYAEHTSPSKDAFVGLLRADLSATRSESGVPV